MASHNPVDPPEEHPMSDAMWELMTRQWFERTLQPVPDRLFAIFLMNIYRNAEIGRPISKKEAWTQVGIEDVKTGRKYLARAVESELILVVRSETDRRKELLYPTQMLESAVRYERIALESSIRVYARMISERLEEKTKEDELPLLQKVLRALMEVQRNINPEGANSNIIRTMWNKFLSGDQTAFAGNFYNEVGLKERAELRYRYTREPNFRRKIDWFIRLYEELLEQVVQTEDSKALWSHLGGTSGMTYTVALDVSDALGTPRSWANAETAKAALSGQTP